MAFNRDSRGGFQSRGRSSYGNDRGDRGGFSPRGRSSFGSSDRGPREMFKTTCSNCGKECEVPFRPTNGKPVYCSDCFEKMGGRNSEPRPERSDRPEFRQASSSFDANKARFDEMNAKMDRILSLLEPKAKAPVEKEKEEVKPAKAKKAKIVASKE